MSNIKKITFILPTKNRIEKIKKFYQINENKFKKISHCYLIITSNNKEKLILQKYFRKKKLVKIIKQKKSGFMNACFESISHIKTKYCTFLYDDDLLSPYIYKIFKIVFTKNIAMGYGLINKNILKKNFLPIKINKISSEKLLSCYFGKNLKGIKFMPVSPICLVFPSFFLIKWKKEIINFCKNNSLRTEMLLRRNIGPDLMLYLHQIINYKNIDFSFPHIAEFKMHEKSMSYILGKNKLRIGYWLAKCSILNSKKISAALNKKIFTFLILSGYLILSHNFILNIMGRENYYYNFKKEIHKIKSSKKNEFQYKYALKIIINRMLKLL